jgi:hypothetical protein
MRKGEFGSRKGEKRREGKEGEKIRRYEGGRRNDSIADRLSRAQRAWRIANRIMFRYATYTLYL